MFGIFLVAVTILGVALSVILALRNTPEVNVPSWVTNWGWWLQHNVEDTQQEVRSAKEEIRDYLQPLVMFGIFLVAVTILGVALSVILALRNTPEVNVPSWVTNWGWWLLLGTMSIASVATALMGVLAAWRLFRGHRL